VGNGAEELERVVLLLQRIALDVGRPVHDHASRLDLCALALAGRLLDQALDGHAAPRREALDVALVVGERGFGEDLDIAQARAVVELEEAETGLRVASRADPALQGHFQADAFRPAGLSDRDLRHPWDSAKTKRTKTA